MRADPKTTSERPVRPDARRRVGRLVTTWAALTLGGLVTLTALTLAYLVRRGRRLRENLGPARRVEWPEASQPDGPGP